MRMGWGMYTFGLFLSAVFALGAGLYVTEYSESARARALQPEIDELWELYSVSGISQDNFSERKAKLIQADPSLEFYVEAILSARADTWRKESQSLFEHAVSQGSIKLLATAEVDGVTAELWALERRFDRLTARILVKPAALMEIAGGVSRSSDLNRLDCGGTQFNAVVFGGGTRWELDGKTLNIPAGYARALVREFKMPKAFEGSVSITVTERLLLQTDSGRKEKAFRFEFHNAPAPPAPKQVFFNR